MHAFRVSKSAATALTLAVVGLLFAACQRAPSPANVDDRRLASAAGDADNWMSYGRDWDEQRFSPLDQINDRNIADLELAWSLELDTARGQEATPLIVDGVIYTSTAWSKIMAVNAATGELLWMHDPQVIGAKAAHACCDVVNRGVAVWKGNVFAGTLDGRLIALDAATGELLWSVVTVDQELPYTITMAPRVYRDKVIIGNSGAELGVRGYVSAYDTATGNLVWRFYTVPGNPADGPDGAASDSAIEKLALPTWHGQWWELGGGGTVWDSVVYDRKYNQLLIGVGNGSPWNHRIRSEGKGDNLFLSSIVAVDPDTGEYKWHYQANPGETWDFTNTQQITLATLEVDGRARDVLMQAPKNGFFYVLDRKDGKLISADPFANQTWAERIDLETGRPIETAGARYEDEPFFTLPSGIGAHAWMPMSYSPKTGLVYIPVMNFPLTYSNDESYEVHKGRWNTGVSFLRRSEASDVSGEVDDRRAEMSKLVGELVAWDPVARKARWKVERDWPWNGGTLATAGNLVFQGTVHGEFEAYSADRGEKLWSFQTHRGIVAGPVSYRVNGEQYIAVMAGYGGSMGMASPSPFEKRRMPNGIIVAFKLKGGGALPPYAPQLLAPANPSTEEFTPEQIAEGREHYYAFCAICHSGPVNPDLRRSGLLADADAWRMVVIDGALEQNGMASFRDYLSGEETEAIRAYVNQQAEALLSEEAL